MKKVVSLLVLSVAIAGRLLAQNFEGTITWKMTADVDPAMRAQMDQAQAQLQSPEMQAKLAQARAAMNTPEMQAMMKSNPQMRAMIEKQMGLLNHAPKAAAPGGNGIFPDKFVCQVKGPRAHITVEGGMVPMETIALGDQQVAYRIDRANRTYQKLTSTTAAAQMQEAAGTDFKITPTAETEKIAGYNCRRYEVEQTGSHGSAMKYSVWATNDIQGFDVKQLEAMRVGRDGGPNFMTRIGGVPLKVLIDTPQAKLTMQAESVTREAVPESAFALPAGFTEAGM